MSFFDIHFSSDPSTKNRFFKKFTNKAIFDDIPALFSCSVTYWKENGASVSTNIKIIDSKFVIYKNKKPNKYLDLREMYRLGSPMNHPKSFNQDEKNYLTFMKKEFNWIIFVQNTENFIALKEILKQFCVLSNFSLDYEILEFLGKGYFAEVYSVRNLLTKKIFAAKMFEKDSEKNKKNALYIKREIETLRLLPESNYVVKLFEIYEEKDRILIILELMEGKSLEDYIKQNPKLPEHQIFNIFYQLLKGTSFMHSCDVMHRDIKPENILFQKEKDIETLKIADFSLAQNFSKTKTFDLICGTPGFMAPEIFTKEGYDEKVDLYSLGLILYTLCTGNPAFRGKDKKEVINNNISGKIRFISTEWEGKSRQAKKTVKYLLRKNPKKRIELSQIFHLKWVKKFAELNRKRSLQFDDTLSTNEVTKTTTLTKDYGKKLKSGKIRTLSEQKTQNVIESFTGENNEKPLKNLIEIKHQLIENSGFHNSKHDSSSFLDSFGLSKSKQESSSFLESMGFSKRKQDTNMSLQKMPSFFENYKLTSFMLYSKPDLKNIGNIKNQLSKIHSSCSMSGQHLSPSKSQTRKNTCSKLDESLFLIIDETKREMVQSIEIEKIKDSCRNKSPQDLDLSIIVPRLNSVVFKKITF